jgi:CubicO group peptidase (beta-lactamase class C family)
LAGLTRGPDSTATRPGRALSGGLGPAVLLFAFAACTGQEPAVSEVPSTDYWDAGRTVSPREAGLDPAPLDRLRSDAAEGAYANLHAILIVKGGTLVFEEYYNGFDRDTRQYTASISKSVGSILVGIAMDRGLLPGLEQGGVDRPVLELLPEYEDILWADPIKRRLLLRHVLTMSAGLEWDETSYPYDDPRNDWVSARDRDDPVEFTLRKRLIAEPGAEFVYNGGLSILLSYLVEKNSGMSASEFAERHLFSPLGIEDFEWERLDGGLTDTDGGLHMRPRDLAKLGLLYLNGGEWAGSRIVSEAWVEESTREHLVNEGSPNYGFQWWCGDFHYAGRSAYAFLASGHGGQTIFVFPAFDLLVVLTHEVFDNPMGQLHDTSILTRYVLPAADSALHASGGELDPEASGASETPIEADAAALARYAGLYSAGQEELRVEYRDGRLYANAEGAPEMRMIPLGDTRFRATALDLIDVRFNFDVDDRGVVRGLRAAWGFNDTTFERVDPDAA